MAVFRSEYSHYRNILTTMNDLRKQKSPCDVRIKVGNQEIRAHRCVLMAASDYISSVLADIDCEVKSSYIDVSSTTQDASAVESVINYLYSGEIRIDNDNLQSIIKVALLFNRADVKDFCCKFMLDDLDLKTSMTYNQFALDYGFPVVQQQSALMIKSRFQPAMFSDNSFQNIKPEELKFLVSSCDIFDNCGLIKILEFLSDWVQSGTSKEHEQAACDVLRYIILKTDAKDMDSFADMKLNELSFKELFENVALFLNRKLSNSKGTNNVVFTSPLQYVKESKDPTTLESHGASIQNTEMYSESSYQLGINDNDDQVDSDAMITESALSTDDLHKISVDIDNTVIKTEANGKGQTIVKSDKCLKDIKDSHSAFSCEECHQKFNKLQQLNIHKKIHNRKGSFKCVVCKKKFTLKKYLNKHMIVHNTETRYSCNVCDKLFKWKESLVKHMVIHTGSTVHVCTQCSKPFPSSSSLKVHMLKHSVERKHMCKICRKMYKHKRDLEAHEVSHTTDSIYKCDTCGLCFETQQAIQEHVKLHEDVIDPLCQIKSEIENLQIKTEIENLEGLNTDMAIDTFDVDNKNKDYHLSEIVKEENKTAHDLKQVEKPKCGLCNKHLKSQHHLKIHMKTHSTINPYDCVICKRKFKLKFYLKKHMKRHHSGVPDVCYRCSICQKQFREKTYLTTHMLFHEGIKRHFCTVCNKGFIVKGALTNHMKTHDKREKTLPCQICFKLFKDNTGLKRHMVRHVDPGPKTYICEVCGLEYKHESSLREHKKDAHSKTKIVFQCELCNKTFKRKGALTKHRDTHSDSKPFICPTCGKQCRREDHLANHMLIHSDEKQYSCTECSSNFRDKSALLRHFRIHTGEKSHYCKLCEKYFTRAENLRGHISRFHKSD